MERPFSAQLVSKTLPTTPPHCSSSYKKQSKKPKPKASMQKTLDGKNLLRPISLQNTTTTMPLEFYLSVQPYSRSSLALVPSQLAVRSKGHGSLHPTLRIKDTIVHRHQPNKMGFKKVVLDRWEFASEGFLRGQKHLLKTLRRKRAPSHLPSQHSSAQLLEVRQFGFDREIDQLRHDKSILMAEMVKLRQEQQNMGAHLMAMEARLQGTEQKQQQMMAFLARALHNCNFLHQSAQRNDRNKELKQAISKKRRRPIYQVSTSCDGGTSNGLEWSPPVKNEDNEYSYEVSELESLALEIQGFGRSSDSREELEEKDEGELTSDDDFNVLAEQMGYMSSFSPK